MYLNLKTYYFDLKEKIWVKLRVLTKNSGQIYDRFQFNRLLNVLESGHHYSEKPAYGGFFAFVALLK